MALGQLGGQMRICRTTAASASLGLSLQSYVSVGGKKLVTAEKFEVDG